MRLALVEAFHAYIGDETASGNREAGRAIETRLSDQGDLYSTDLLGRTHGGPTNSRLIVPGYVRHRRLPPPLACLSTRSDPATAARVRDVSSGAACVSSSAGQVSRPEMDWTLDCGSHHGTVGLTGGADLNTWHTAAARRQSNSSYNC